MTTLPPLTVCPWCGCSGVLFPAGKHEVVVVLGNVCRPCREEAAREAVAVCEHGAPLDDDCLACKADAENDARYDAMKEGD